VNKCFFSKVQLANQSIAKSSQKRFMCGSQIGADLALPPTTNDVFKRFNRDTKRLTVALLSILTSCALALSTVGSELLLVHSNEKNFTEDSFQRQEAPGMTTPKERESRPDWHKGGIVGYTAQKGRGGKNDDRPH
jgi:hypothetical protein